MEFDEAKFKPTSNREYLYQQVLEQSDVCDVTVQVGKWRKRFHWCVLIMSPFFECLRRCDFIEKQTGVIDLNVGSPLAVEISILFLYGKKPTLTEENVAAILELSEFLIIPNLKCACVRYLRDITITDENCMKMLDLFSLYNFELTKCDDYMRGHLHEVLKKKEAMRLTKESVIHLMTDPLLSFVSCDEKLRYLVDWAEEFEGNKSALSEVFAASTLDDIDPMLWETLAVNHPFIVNMTDGPKVDIRHARDDQRVLIFTDLAKGERITCFHLDREKWFGLESKLTEGNSATYASRQCCVKGVRGSQHSEIYIYRQHMYNDISFNISKQDLRSMDVIDSRINVNVPGAHVPTNSSTMSDWSLFGEIIIGLSKKRIPKKNQQRAVIPKYSYDPFLARLIQNSSMGHWETSYLNTTTVYYGELRYPETTVEPIITILNSDLNCVCMNSQNQLGFLSLDQKIVFIYDMSTCLLDDVALQRYLKAGQKMERYCLKIVGTENGFIVYDKKCVFSISRLHGPELTDKYSVKMFELGTEPEWRKVIYHFCDDTWFRILQRSWDEYVEFSILPHKLLRANDGDLAWRQLPCTKQLDSMSWEGNMFMISLPKSVLKCHPECPHCEQIKQQNRPSVSSYLSRRVDEDDYLYQDSDDEDYDVYRCVYSSSEDDYYYYSSD